MHQILISSVHLLSLLNVLNVTNGRCAGWTILLGLLGLLHHHLYLHGAPWGLLLLVLGRTLVHVVWKMVSDYHKTVMFPIPPVLLSEMIK